MSGISWLTEPNYTTWDTNRRFETLASLGWHVLPVYGVKNGKCLCGNIKCKSPGKHPMLKNGVYSATNNPKLARQYDERYPFANIGISLPGIVCVDVDPRNQGVAPAWLPPTMQHLSGRGDGGTHYLYHLPKGVDNDRLKTGTSPAPGVDVKTGFGQLLVFPPSVHVNGGVYTTNGEPMANLTEQQLQLLGILKPAGGGEVADTLLTTLLNNPPQVGSRNNWMTKVAGHLAKLCSNKPDVYFALGKLVNRSLETPLSPSELHTCLNSIWNSEFNRKTADPFNLDAVQEDTGYLFNHGGYLSTVHQKGKMVTIRKVANFALTCDFKCVFSDGSTGWLCTADCDGTQTPLLFTPRSLSIPAELDRLLLSKGLVYNVPTGVTPAIPGHTRLQLWLTGQNAPVLYPTDQIGWVGKDFHFQGGVWSEGLLTAEVHAVSPRIPTSELTKYNFGAGKPLSWWKQVFKKVVGFHDPLVTSVYSSWLMATLLKPYLLKELSIFPVVAVVGTSETGKTTGFFPLINRLFGMDAGAGVYTTAALRNSLECVNCSFVWLDDLEDTSHLMELIRSVTSRGMLTKVSPDFMGNLDYRLYGSLVISAESNPFGGQKALSDRVILLEPPPVTNRVSRSKKHRGKPQWLDVVDVKRLDEEIDGGFPATAGAVIKWIQDTGAIDKIPAMVLQTRTLVGGFGRQVDAYTCLLVGATLLRDMTGVDVYTRVLKWINANRIAVETPSPNAGIGDNQDAKDENSQSINSEGDTVLEYPWDNTLTLKLLPWALSRWSWSDDPRSATGGKPVWVDGDTVLFSPMLLAQAWFEYTNGRVNERTESADSLIRQAKVCGAFETNPRYVVVSTRSTKRRRYRSLPPQVSKVVLQRSRE